MGAGSLLACGVAAEPGIGGQVVWAGGLLQEAFLTLGFSYGGLLNFQLYSFLGLALSSWVRALSLKAHLQV